MTVSWIVMVHALPVLDGLILPPAAPEAFGRVGVCPAVDPRECTGHAIKRRLRRVAYAKNFSRFNHTLLQIVTSGNPLIFLT